MSDYSLTTFGESGELTQVRHALTAVGHGETTIGIDELLTVIPRIKRVMSSNARLICLGISSIKSECLIAFKEVRLLFVWNECSTVDLIAIIELYGLCTSPSHSKRTVSCSTQKD